jgi:hypothetical protein
MLVYASHAVSLPEKETDEGFMAVVPVNRKFY